AGPGRPRASIRDPRRTPAWHPAGGSRARRGALPIVPSVQRSRVADKRRLRPALRSYFTTLSVGRPRLGSAGGALSAPCDGPCPAPAGGGGASASEKIIPCPVSRA